MSHICYATDSDVRAARRLAETQLRLIRATRSVETAPWRATAFAISSPCGERSRHLVPNTYDRNCPPISISTLWPRQALVGQRGCDDVCTTSISV